MTWLRVLACRVHALFASERLDRDLEEELRNHVEMETEANLRGGMRPEEARRAAIAELGGIMRTAEECRRRRGLPLLESLLQDFRLAMRLCVSNRGFTFAAIVPLAVAIGFVTAVTALVDAMLFRPLAVRDSSTLATLYTYSRPEVRFQSASYADFRDVATLHDQVESATAWARIPVSADLGVGVEQLWSEVVTGGYFSTVGVSPVLGRPLMPRDEGPGAKPVVVISHALWESGFHRSSAVLDASVKLNGIPCRIVGVLPRGYAGTVLDWSPPPAFWIPLASLREIVPHFRTLDYENRREMRWLLITARLRRPLPELQAALDVVSARGDQRPLLRALPLAKARFFPTWRKPALRFASVLGTISGAVLLMACFNLSTLLLSRLARREREIGTRLAIGAGPARILQQFLVESVLLASGVVFAGLPLSLWFTCWMGSVPRLFSVPLALDLSFNPRVLASCGGVGIAAAILAGVVPALRASRTDVAGKLNGRRLFSLRGATFAAEVACVMAMLPVAVMLVGSLHHLNDAPLGYDPQNMLLGGIETHSANLSAVQAERLYRGLLSELRAHPVRAAALASEAFPTTLRTPKGVTPLGGAGRAFDIDAVSVSDGYFETLAMPVEAGRGFSPADTAASPRVAVVNRSAASLLWPGENPLGRRLRLSGQPGSAVVVGVAADARYHSLVESSVPYLFLPLSQEPTPQITMYVRTAGEPLAFVPALRQTVARLAAGIPISGIRTLDRQIQETLAPMRLSALAAAVAASIGAAVALAGLFAAIAYRLAHQQRDIAIRIALGARHRTVMLRFAAEALWVALAGAVAGMAPAIWAAARLRGTLEGVDAAGPAVFVGSMIALLAAVVLTLLIALRSILRVEPAAILRVQ